MDGLAGARQEHIEDRQRPVDRPVRQLRLHVVGDEEAVVHERADRALDVLQRVLEERTLQRGQLRDVADGLETGKHVSRCVGEERGGVEEVRPAEHVQHGVVLVGQVLLGKGANPRQRRGVLPLENCIEIARVVLPARIAGQRRQWRIGRRRQPGQEVRGIVGGRGIGGAHRRERQCQRHRHGQKHGRRQLRHSRRPPRPLQWEHPRERHSIRGGMRNRSEGRPTSWRSRRETAAAG